MATTQANTETVSDVSIRAMNREEMHGETSMGDAITNIADGDVVKNVIDSKLRIPNTLVSLVGDGTKLDIIRYLQKPVIATSGTFASTDVATTFSNLSVFNTLNANQMRIDKLSGVYAVRATAHWKIEFNATRFQMGRYILAFIADGGAPASPWDTNWQTMHSFNLTTTTQLPHVEFDINCDTSAELVIPYKSCFSAYVVTSTGKNNTLGDPGYVHLRPYIPLVNGSGSTVVPWTMWSWFSDIELYGNTIPQSGRFTFKKKKMIKGRDVITEEVQETQPLSGGLQLVSDISSNLAGIPLLSSIAGPLSWVSDALAKSALSFGWSSPIIGDQPHRIFREAHPLMANSDAPNNSTSMSLSYNNHVDVLPGFSGSDLDEMSIDFLKSIYSFYFAGAWTTSDAAGATLFTSSMYPGNFTNAVSDGVGMAVFSLTPVSFLANMFSLYSGSLTLSFKFVKTEFHSGRIMIAFMPVDTFSGTAVTMTYSQANTYAQKEIIDLRHGSEFEINFPYVSNSVWRSTNDLTSSSYGYVAMFVLDALQAPNTVSSTIYYVVEVKGGRDLRFAVPKAHGLSFILPTAIQAGPLADITCKLSKTTIGDSQSETLGYSPEAATIGEAAISLRQLVKRSNIVIGSARTVTGTGGNLIIPHYCSVPKNALVPEVVQQYDMISLLYCMYAQSRGSIRLRFLEKGIVNNNNYFFTSLFVNNVTTAGTAFLSTYATNDADWAFDTQNLPLHQLASNIGGTSIQVPQYHKLHSRLNCLTLVYGSTGGASTFPYTGQMNDMTQVRMYTTSGGSAPTCFVARSGGDDFNCGNFVSIPPMITISRP